MKQQGIGTVVGATTSDVLRKMKETRQETDRRRKPAPGKDTVSISAEAREMMASEQESATEEEGSETETGE